MRLELTNTELTALTRGGVPADAITEARNMSVKTVVESTMASAAPPKPAPPDRVHAARQPVAPAVAPRRGLFARFLDALFGVKCWPLILMAGLCSATNVMAQPGTDMTQQALQPPPEPLSASGIEPNEDRLDLVDERSAAFLDLIFDSVLPEPVRVGTDGRSSEAVQITEATGTNVGTAGEAYVAIVEPGTAHHVGVAPSPEESHAPSSLSRESDVPYWVGPSEVAPPPRAKESDRAPHVVWITVGATFMFVAALVLFTWRLRGLELQVEQFVRRASLAHHGHLEICVKCDGCVEVTAPPGGVGSARSLQADPTPDDLPTDVPTNVSVFNDRSAWRTGTASQTGPRDENQDASKVMTVVRSGDTGYEFFDVAVLADGLGGEPGGRRAALLATEWAASSVIAQLDSGSTQFDSIAEKAMGAASNALRRDAEDLGVEAGLRTTLIVSVVSRETGRGAIASIGDSEVFIRRSDGAVEQCVRPQKGILPHQVAACLGPEQLGTPQVVEVALVAGDMLVLTSDGVVQPDEERLSPADAAHGLVWWAAAHNCNLSEAAISVINHNLACGGFDVFGRPVFDDNQTIAVIGTGRPPEFIGIPPGFRLSA